MSSPSEAMRDFDRLEDRLKLHRQVNKRAILIVEGPDDVLVLQQHLLDVELFPADGKNNVTRAVQQLYSWNVQGVRGIVDADFDDHREFETVDGVILYDARDLEGMLIKLGVLTTVLEHQGSGEKLQKSGGVDKVCLDLTNEATAIANIRMANRRHGWGLRFKDVDLNSKVDRKSLKVKLDNYVNALLHASETSVQKSEVLDAALQEDESSRGPRGKDVLSLAGVALRGNIGSLPAAAAGVDVLCAQLHSSAGYLLDRSEWMSSVRESLVDSLSEF